MNDEGRDLEGYERQTGIFRVAPAPGRRVMLAGGWEEDDAIGFNFTVFHPDDADRVKRFAVRIPVTVDGNDLVVGEPEVREL